MCNGACTCSVTCVPQPSEPIKWLQQNWLTWYAHGKIIPVISFYIYKASVAKGAHTGVAFVKSLTALSHLLQLQQWLTQNFQTLCRSHMLNEITVRRQLYVRMRVCERGRRVSCVYTAYWKWGRSFKDRKKKSLQNRAVCNQFHFPVFQSRIHILEKLKTPLKGIRPEATIDCRILCCGKIFIKWGEL